MKILYLIDNLSIGGAQTLIRGIFENNPDDRNIYSVALRTKEPDIRIEHPNTICLPHRSKYSLFPLFYLRHFIRSKRIDVLHCQLPRSIVFGYLLKRFFFPHVLYIIHEQGDIFESRLYALLLRILKRKADGIIACSEATRRKLSVRTGIKSEDIKLIYNFVDLNRFKMTGYPVSSHFTVGFAGRIERRKGWREFVKAAVVFRSNDKLKFLLAGTGREEKKLTRMISKYDLKNIEFDGFVKNMETFYRQLQLLVIPSHFEPMGMVAVEAMACGIPLLGTDVPGLNEVIKHGRNGWLVHAGSVDQMVIVIENILTSTREEIETIVKHNLLDAKAYSFDDFYKKILQFHEDMTDDK
jgi:glycosyltransferase involved in cell wall biosynthesis